jgi:hypothetical protein
MPGAVGGGAARGSALTNGSGRISRHPLPVALGLEREWPGLLAALGLMVGAAILGLGATGLVVG